MTIRKKFSLFDHTEIPADQRLDEIEHSKKQLPKKYSFGGSVEHEVPIARCVYCGQPMFEIKTLGSGDIVASCATPGCMANQNTPQIYLEAKRKMDDKLRVRNGVWQK